MPTMTSNVASNDPPMTLARRLILEQSRVTFHVAPHEMIFSVTILDLLDKQHLIMFVDNLLSKLNHEYPTNDTPSPGFWKLMINDEEEDLTKWNPQNLQPDTTILVISNVEQSLVHITTTPTNRNGTAWAWAHEMRSFKLPADVVFEVQGDSHLLLVLRCQTKVKISNRQKRTDETIHRILVPTNYTVAEVLNLVRASIISGVFEEPYQDDLRKRSDL